MMEIHDKHQDRLSELAREVGVVPMTQLGLAPAPPLDTGPSPEDVDKVKVELGRRRSTLKRSLHGTSTAKEATALLENLIDSECTAGQAKYLISLGADVNYTQRKSGNLVKRVRGKNQEDIRSDVLRRVVEHRKHSLIRALAPAADQNNKNDALGAAINLEDIESVRILMAYGADSNQCCPQIQNAIQQKHYVMVVTLIGADNANRLSAESATILLHQAVSSGELQVVQALLYCGADTNNAGTSSIVTAVLTNNVAMVAALCVSHNRPSPEYLTRALTSTCSAVRSSTTNLRLVEILLAAGASGEGVSRILAQAAQRGEHQLLDLVTQYATYDERYAPEAARHAMSAGDLRTFNSLMKMSLTENHANELLHFIINIRPCVSESVRVAMVKALAKLHPTTTALGYLAVDACKHQEMEMIQCLLHARLRSADVTAALDNVVQYGLRNGFNYKLLELLVDGGADVNFKEGACLVSVVHNTDTRALELLLAGRPNAMSLNAAFVAGEHMGWTEEHYQLSEMLVKAGTTGSCIDRALLNVLDASEIACRFRRLFLDHGKADVNHQEGESLAIAVGQQNIHLLQQLIEYSPTSSSFYRALALSVRTIDAKARWEMSDIILRKGQLRHPKMLEQVLFDAVRLYQTDNKLVALLLQSGASVDYGDGRTLLAAIDLEDGALLDQLLSSANSPRTLARCLAHILHSDNDDARKVTLSSIVLGSKIKLDKMELGTLMSDTFSEIPDVSLLQLFLDHGASVNLEPPKAINKAIDLSNRTALKLMMSTRVSPTTVATAFAHAWKAKDENVEFLRILTQNQESAVSGVDENLLEVLRSSPVNIGLIKYLLEIGAHAGPLYHDCINTAAVSHDKTVLELLLKHVKSRQTVSSVFEEVMTNEEVWTDPSRVPIVQTLLEHGAFGEDIDENMLLSVERYHTHANASDIMGHLISFEASADYKNGISMQAAAQRCDQDVVKKLLTSKVSAATITTAFPHVLLSNNSPEIVLAMIETFASSSKGMLDLKTAHVNGEPPLFIAIRRFPQNADILGSLLHYGAPVDQATGRVLDKNFAFEAVTPLGYALSGLPGDIHDKHVEMLIAAGANVNFTTANSKFNPLIGAVKHNRVGIVELLLARNARPSEADYLQRTPLCYASMKGNLDIMRLLIKAGAPVDDGSLHDAIVHTEYAAAKLLLENGHGANIPSVIHENKNPLVLLVQNESRSGLPAGHIEMLRMLVDKGAKKSYRLFGKSLLLLALDCRSATSIVPVLLAAFAGEEINEEYNLWHNNGFVYSPLSYVMHNQQQSDACHKNELLIALAPYNCAAVYYHESGPQPAGFVGAPLDLVQREQRRQARLQVAAELEEDHQNAIRRQRELEMQQTSQMQRQHEMRLALENERNRVQLQQQKEASMQAEQFEVRRRQAQLEQVRQENDLQLEFKGKLALQDQASLDAQVQMRRQMLEIEGQNRSNEEAAHTRMHQRNLEEIQARIEGASTQQRLLENQRKMLTYQAQTQRLLQNGPAEEVD